MSGFIENSKYDVMLERYVIICGVAKSFLPWWEEPSLKVYLKSVELGVTASFENVRSSGV